MGGRSGKRIRESSNSADDILHGSGQGTEKIPGLIPGSDERAAACQFLGLPASAPDEHVFATLERLQQRDGDKLQEYYSRFVEPRASVTREVRFVDARTYARLRAWQRDPRYGHSPFEAVHEGRDPEDVEDDYTRGPDGDPDFDERITVVEYTGGRRVARRLRQIPEYRRHVRRLNGLLSRADGFEKVLDELRRAVTPALRKTAPLPAPIRYYRYDAMLPAPYFRKFQRLTRELLSGKKRRADRELVERVIALLTTHRDTRGRPPGRDAVDPDAEKLVREKADLVKSAVTAIVRAIRDDDITGRELYLETRAKLGLKRGQSLRLRPIGLEEYRLFGRPQQLVNELLYELVNGFHPSDYLLSGGARISLNQIQRLIKRKR